MATKKNAKKESKKDYIEFTVFDSTTDIESITVRLRKGKKGRINATISAGAFCIYATVRESEDGYFLAYPSWKDSEDNYHNYCYCFDKETIENLTEELNEHIDEL